MIYVTLGSNVAVHSIVHPNQHDWRLGREKTKKYNGLQIQPLIGDLLLLGGGG